MAGWLAWGAVGLATCACSGNEAAAEPSGAALPQRIVVTADFLERSLRVFDHDRLLAGDAADAARVSTIDLSAYAPGPIQVEIAPDGDTAVVAVGPGFFQGLGVLFGFPSDIPDGGQVLIVSLSEGKVLHEVETAQPPLGLAISPDGSVAYSANYGDSANAGDTLSLIDIASGTLLDEIMVGGGPEQVSLSEDGSLAAINVASLGGVRLFETADPAGTLSPVVPTSQDPSDVAFVGDVVVVGDSLQPSGYSLLDASDPSAPALLESVDLPGGIPYAASAIPGTSHALVGVATSLPAELVEVDVSTTPSSIVRSIELGNATSSFPLGAAVSPDGSHAFVALPVANELAIVDLSDASVRRVGWSQGIGPTYAAVAFRE